MIEISEKFLVSLGGWPAMKQARILHQTGHVSDASFEPPMLRAKVTEGGREFVAALRIRNSIDIENLCPCRESRARGLICAHVMAAGLAVIHPVPTRRTESPMTDHASAMILQKNVAGTTDLPTVQIKLEGSLRHLEAEVRFTYATPGVSNPVAEAAAMSKLLAAGFRDQNGKAVLKDESAILSFYGSRLPEWKKDWDVSVGERFEHVTKDFIRVRPICKVQDNGTGWLDFHVHYAAGADAIFSHSDLKQMLASGGAIRLKSGKVALADATLAADIDEVLRDCDPRQERGRYRVHPRQRGYLESSVARWTGEVGPDHAATINLGSISKLLRPYQIDGARWLTRRALAGTGGLLADEMGLGKTVQALAMIEALRLAGDTRPAMVVCPSSLVWNWQSEAKKFLPGLSVLAIAGADRLPLFDRIPAHGLVITSYALLRRDIDAYRPHEFAAIILDEAQHIKNPDSQNAKAALKLPGGSRFILTGTPVENALSDLWSLFEFLLPGYLGGRKDFRDRYEEPLSGGAAPPDVRERLARRLAPFVLRRLKAEILTDLPPKLEQILEIELTPKQKAAYTEIQRAARDQADALLDKSNDAAARMRVLTALLRLRQAACDLRLVNPDFPDGDEASAKLDALRELLAESIDGGHRVLVFSQFTSMLDRIGDALLADGTRFCRLDGSTRDRQRVVEEFQNNDEIPVFLISLKAGGVGLNLTAADTVIHFDPWWNPAVEAQATDRAHRIGQDRVVTSIKLIARDTVEQRVLALQEKKRSLFENAIDADQLAGTLDLNDIRDLIG